MRYQDRICANSKTGGNQALQLNPKCNGARATKRCTVYYNATNFSTLDLCAACAQELFYDCSRHQLRLVEESIFRAQLSKEQRREFRRSRFFWKGTRAEYIAALSGLVINSREFSCLVEVDQEMVVTYGNAQVIVDCPTRAQLRGLVADLLGN